MEQTEKASEHQGAPDMFEEHWSQLRGQVRSWWDRLTDADLDQVAGNKSQLVRVIQARYGHARERAEDLVEQRLREYYHKMAPAGGDSLREKVTATAQGVASSVAGTAGDVGTRVQDLAAKAGTAVAETATRAGAHLPDLPGDVAGFIRRYPIPSLLAGVGVGFLLARLFRPGWMGVGEQENLGQGEAGYPNAIIQCSQCGQMVRQADMVHHSTVCSGSGIPSQGGSPS
ncbi:MAG TPA: hypothetical protein VLK82_01340 [Candidatus Tectomicrobia bacterium]|nr:hypothetical protein [Candidatus Tectomicrobia bacterium]